MTGVHVLRFPAGAPQLRRQAPSAGTARRLQVDAMVSFADQPAKELAENSTSLKCLSPEQSGRELAPSPVQRISFASWPGSSSRNG